jgi:photosystem II stability/assembly factor-like uncharacterized protein
MVELFVATGDALAHLRQEQEGWIASLKLQGQGIQCLTLDPHHPRTLYAGSSGKGVWKSTDGGITWLHLNLPQTDIFSLVISPVDGTVYAGCEPSMLFKSVDGGESWHELAALRSISSAPTWSFPPRPWTSHVRWIAPHPQDAHVLLVGIEAGGLMYSGDGGETWLDHRANAQRDVHALAWHPHVPGRAYEAGGGGTAWSHDGGQSWVRVDEGRDRHYSWGLAVDPDDPDCWYISACSGPRHAHYSSDAQATIYRWRGSGPWEPVLSSLISFPYALTAMAGQLYAGLGDGTIYTSADQGDNWQCLKIDGDQVSRVLAMVCAVG